MKTFDPNKRWTVGVDYADANGSVKHSEIFSVDSIREIDDAYPGELIVEVRAVRNSRGERTWAEKWHENESIKQTRRAT